MSLGNLEEGLFPADPTQANLAHVGGQLTRCFLFNFDVQILTRAIYKFDIDNGGLMASQTNTEAARTH